MDRKERDLHGLPDERWFAKLDIILIQIFRGVILFLSAKEKDNTPKNLNHISHPTW